MDSADEKFEAGSEDWSSEGSSDAKSPHRDLADNTHLGLLVPIGRSGWAIAAGYLGLASVLLYPAPLAIIAGVLAIRDIRANPAKRGLGRAWFGILAGTLGTVGLVLWQLKGADLWSG